MLPGPYERWYVDMAGRASPVETRSTCESCAMLPGAPGLPAEGPFDPVTRCCTYHPHLAPYLVGGILRDGTPAGQRIVRERMAARAGVSPLGLGPSPEFAARYQQIAAQPGAFGRRREIQCPFNAESRCTIWQHRGLACAAFHCKYDRGALGAGLWNLLVIAFNSIERALARWLLARQGLDAAACDALLHAPLDDALDARAWGRFRGREEAYFLEAASLVEPLSWSAVAARCEGQLAGLAEALRGAVERFDQLAPPERVQRNPAVLLQLGGGRARFLNPGVPLDPLEIPAGAGEQLARLETGELAALGFDAALLRKLLDWQALEPAIGRTDPY